MNRSFGYITLCQNWIPSSKLQTIDNKGQLKVENRFAQGVVLAKIVSDPVLPFEDILGIKKENVKNGLINVNIKFPIMVPI